MFTEPGELLGRVLDALEVPVVVLDAKGRVVLVNRAAERLSGQCAAAVFGEPFPCAFVAEADRPEAEAALERLLATPPAEKIEAEGAGPKEASSEATVLVETHLQAGEPREDGELIEDGAAPLRLVRWSARRVEGTSGGSETGRGAVVTGIDCTRERVLERETVSAEEQLRRRFGAELHDMLASHLAGTAMMASALARKLERGGTASAEAVRRVTELIREAMEQVRALSHSFVAPELESEQLGEALNQLVQRTEAASGVACCCEVEERVVEALPGGEQAVHLYRIAQEALSNAARHAGPHRVRLRVKLAAENETLDAEKRDGEAEGRRLVLEVRDDGKGLPEEEAEGVGLRNMRRRAELMGARLEVETGASGGTCVRCVLPLDAGQAASDESL